jgi:hypothetical protein
MDLSAGREIDGLECPEPREDRRELRVLMLGRGREEQGIVPGDALDELVLALQVLAELEGIALALEPGLLLPLRPGMEPLLDKSLVRGEEAVLITDVPTRNEASKSEGSSRFGPQAKGSRGTPWSGDQSECDMTTASRMKARAARTLLLPLALAP